ncbi:class I histocompatibility antigen, F10 alpha chain-like [Notechis scutatus]|uniref:Class I histocompatibility antigen, F10 alpha chain-like n=1 Tax=Notechis scutatus TaxID=8663 RepID=A0A6J1WB21_9SAUR|nr:class I histocompatibility antigen, F10 alpha chain-like [Notechis scutatus]
METHICRVHGFYPREIDAFWTRDGEVWLQDTLHKSVAPNADGTYHYWLSIRIDPKERGRYRCHVEHDGLQEPLDLALEEPKSNLGIIIGCVVAALVLVGVIAGILVFFKRRQDDYNAVPSEYIDLSSLHVISNLEQGPEAPLVERGVCVCMFACAIFLFMLRTRLGKMGPLFITARLFLEVESSRRNTWNKEPSRR